MPSSPSAHAISAEDVGKARRLLEGQIQRTPMLPSPRLSALTGAEVFVKYENMQTTGSFKERGAYVKLAGLTADERRRGVVAMSAGNHAQAVAFHASRLGIPATIVMPEATPLVKVENTRGYGATVVLHGATLVESEERTRQLMAEQGLVLVHPYDDPAVMAGQGTVALEMLAEAPGLDTLVIPIGGGGLCAGCAVAARSVSPSIRLVGVEAALYPSFVNAIDGGQRPIGGPTLAEGIAVKTVGALTLPIVRDLVEEILLVDEAAIESAVNAYATLARTMAEGAGAAGLAALLAAPDRFRGRKVGLVLCGGNIDARLLASIMVRELEREARISSFRVTVQDRPGLLGQIASRLGELGANILEVSHGRLFLDVPAKGVSLDLTIETRDAAHTEAVLDALARDGLNPRRIERRSQF
ncbi:threonine ammonia-lyase [Alsobacter sp. SYSU M60028]|uniref:Threonine ammonia-lyase n=1 Tax=Alsobacter ponti TaxID=2962936 RepID=A0ABT1LA40_9HYPH|nr:threonine ammonia-lyase [Alsobacter ponti]MCP8938365.1 threonine ammonia-lyase [Alsobacter ponti]